MEKIERLRKAFNTTRAEGVVRTQKEFAALIGISESNFSRAMKEDERYLTESLVQKAEAAVEHLFKKASALVTAPDTVPLLPTSARGGLIGDFSDTIQDYQCERVISPVKGATLAMTVTGDSMSPEYPSGSTVLMKKINEEAFVEWGEVYVLDTVNGPVIKKIRRTPDPHVVECVSINPGYQTYTMNCDYINGWYRVLMVMSIK